MTVLLRAILVIGVLSYFALMRTGADPSAEARRIAGGLPSAQPLLPGAQALLPSTQALLPSTQAALPAALDAVPPETRERVVRAVLARGLMAELSRRAAEPPAADTLEDADRQPAWRGVAPR